MMGLIVHNINMVRIRRTSVYDKWIRNLKDFQARARITSRVKRLSEGNPGDCRFLGDMVSEMRIDYGPGYRIYYKDTGKEIIILLCGGDKTTQEKDIARAKELAVSPLKEEGGGI